MHCDTSVISGVIVEGETCNSAIKGRLKSVSRFKEKCCIYELR